LTAWLLEAERRAVWWTLRDAERWPEWWRGVERVTVLAPDERYRIAWRSRIPYELEFEFTVRGLDEPRCMSGDGVARDSPVNLVAGSSQRGSCYLAVNRPDPAPTVRLCVL
jgi:hypothetical protein